MRIGIELIKPVISSLVLPSMSPLLKRSSSVGRVTMWVAAPLILFACGFPPPHAEVGGLVSCQPMWHCVTIRKILIFGNIYLDYLASSIEKTKEEGGTCTLVFILVYKAGGWGSQTKGLLRGYYSMCVVLKFRLKHWRGQWNLKRREGEEVYDTTPIGVNGESRED